MHLDVALTPTELSDFLLAVAPQRPVMVWGKPGSGKSAIVESFFASVGFPCVSLMGSQIAPEDLIGVPWVSDGVSRFCPPAMIARADPYGLFLDEINRCSHEVQSAFYSLIHEKRVGSFSLHKESIVVAAGNRQQDGAFVKPLSTALVNRMVHVELRVDHRDWLAWAGEAGIHPMVIEYIQTRPDHLEGRIPRTEQPFSSPRSWHILSDALNAFGDTITNKQLDAATRGTISPDHASSFRSWVKVARQKFSLDRILKGEARWPDQASERDALYFLAVSLQARLAKELPRERPATNAPAHDLAYRAKGRIKELAELSLEVAQLAVSAGEEGQPLPAWFITELARDIPRLAAATGAPA